LRRIHQKHRAREPGFGGVPKRRLLAGLLRYVGVTVNDLPFTVTPSKNFCHTNLHFYRLVLAGELDGRHLEPRPEAKVAAEFLLQDFETRDAPGFERRCVVTIASCHGGSTEYRITKGAVKSSGAFFSDQRIDGRRIPGGICSGSGPTPLQEVVEVKIAHNSSASIPSASFAWMFEKTVERLRYSFALAQLSNWRFPE